MTTMAYELRGRTHVACHREQSPTDAEWDAYLADIGARLGRIDAVLAYAPGGSISTGLTVGQQRRASAFWRDAPRKPPIAVVTSSRVIVRTAGALKWFMPEQIKTFGVWDPAGAWAHLGLDERQRRLALESLAALSARLDVTLPSEWRAPTL